MLIIDLIIFLSFWQNMADVTNSRYVKIKFDIFKHIFFNLPNKWSTKCYSVRKIEIWTWEYVSRCLTNYPILFSFIKGGYFTNNSEIFLEIIRNYMNWWTKLFYIYDEREMVIGGTNVKLYNMKFNF